MRLLATCFLFACTHGASPAADVDAAAGASDATPGQTEQQPDPAPGKGIADPPSSSLHDNGCAGVDWQLLGGWLEVEHAAPAIAAAGEMERCVARYAGWVTNDADAANVSRASVYAALAATGQCDATSDYNGALVSGAQCAAVSSGVAPADCIAQMASSHAFGIATLAAVVAQQHAHDPPLTAAYVATGAVTCGGSDTWKLQAPAGFVDHYVAAYNAYQQLATALPACKKHIVMSVALYSGMGDPGAAGVTDSNGCWTYERVSKDNAEWKVCGYDGSVYHPAGPKWAYDDTNTLNDATTEADRISACKTGEPVGGYIYMANRGAGWREVTSTGVRSHFAEIYSSQTAIDDQFATWKAAGEPGAPMINVGEPTTTAAQITAATAQACAEVPDNDWFGLYIYPQSLDGDRLSALVAALNNCTKQ